MKKHILMIRPGASGDALLTCPFIQALRAQYTDPHIAFVSNANVLPLALEFGLAEEISDYGANQWSELFSTAGIQTPALLDLLECTDLAICWLRDPDGLVEQNLCRAEVKRVIVAPGRPPADKRMHIVEYLAETLGLQNEVQLTAPNNAPCFSISLPGEESLSYHRYIAIHPGSGGAHKCWPAQHFAAVIEQLWQRNYPVLLLSGPADQQRVDEILGFLSDSSHSRQGDRKGTLNHLPDSSHPHQGDRKGTPLQNHGVDHFGVSVLGKGAALPTPSRSPRLVLLQNAPLVQVAQHLHQCRCYLGNDSGITHLAAMLGIPTIALFGPSDPLIWRPLGRSVKIIQETPLERLNIDVVVDAIGVTLAVAPRRRGMLLPHIA